MCFGNYSVVSAPVSLCARCAFGGDVNINTETDWIEFLIWFFVFERFGMDVFGGIFSSRIGFWMKMFNKIIKIANIFNKFYSFKSLIYANLLFDSLIFEIPEHNLSKMLN